MSSHEVQRIEMSSGASEDGWDSFKRLVAEFRAHQQWATKRDASYEEGWEALGRLTPEFHVHSHRVNQQLEQLEWRILRTLPVGAMLLWGGPPIDEDHRVPGFVECDGAALSRTKYPALFRQIGTRFSADESFSSNSSQSHRPTGPSREVYFHVPDLRSREHVHNTPPTEPADHSGTASTPTTMSRPDPVRVQDPVLELRMQLVEAQRTISQLVTQTTRLEQRIMHLNRLSSLMLRLACEIISGGFSFRPLESGHTTWLRTRLSGWRLHTIDDKVSCSS